MARLLHKFLFIILIFFVNFSQSNFNKSLVEKQLFTPTTVETTTTRQSTEDPTTSAEPSTSSTTILPPSTSADPSTDTTTTSEIPTTSTEPSTTAPTTTTTATTPITTNPPITTTTTTASTTTSTTTTTTTRTPSTTLSSTTTKEPNSVPKIICYFSSRSTYSRSRRSYSPEDINTSLCTHIIYIFANLDEDSLGICPGDRRADLDRNMYERITSLKSRGLKVLIGIGGARENDQKYSRMIGSSRSRANFIQSVDNFLRQYNFDGISLEWFYPRCWRYNDCSGPRSDKPNFGYLVQEMRNSLPSDTIIAATVSSLKYIIDEAYEVRVLSNELDWINIKTYNYHGHWDGKTGYNAPISNRNENDFKTIDSTVQHWLKLGADKQKLIIAIPFFGRTFTLQDSDRTRIDSETRGPGVEGRFTQFAGILSYFEICSNRNWRIGRNRRRRLTGPYAYQGDQWVSFDDPMFLERKSEYILSNELGGASVLTLDMDDYRNECTSSTEEYPLLKTLNNKLRNI